MGLSTTKWEQLLSSCQMEILHCIVVNFVQVVKRAMVFLTSDGSPLILVGQWIRCHLLGYVIEMRKASTSI